MVKYSFVVPAYNEEEVLALFYEGVTPVFSALDGEYEIIIVNDGSKDKTTEVLRSLCEKDYRVKGVSFSRNFGQQSALLAGLSYAKGQAVVCMDADLQDTPEVAAQMIALWKKGYEIVHAKHKKRKGETFFKKWTASAYYRFVKKATGLDMPLDCGDFKLLDRKAVDVILSLQEKSRVLRSQAAWIGFSQTVLEFDRPPRAAGETKYTLKKMLSLAKNGIFPNSSTLHLFSSKLGIFFLVNSLFAFLTFIILTVLKIDFGGLTAWLFPSMAFCVGILLLNSGLQNEYLREIYKEAQNRPLFLVQDTWNIQNEE